MFEIMVFWSVTPCTLVDRYVPVYWRNLSSNLYVVSHCRRTVTGQAHTLRSVSYLTKPASECPQTHPSVTRHVVGLYWVPGHAGVWPNEITDELARDSSVLKSVEPELALGVSRQDIWRRIRHWLVNQHWIWWWGLRWHPKTGSSVNFSTLSGCQG